MLSNLKAYRIAYDLEKIQTTRRPNTLLIVRMDRIGDYVLFRDFLRAIRQSERFKNYHITLCGNEAFRDIAENCDADFVDDFIWVHPPRFMKNSYANFRSLYVIRKRGFETVIHPTFSRDSAGDMLVYAADALNRIGVDGDHSNQSPERRKITDAFYTKLIKVDKEPQFEFNRNKEIIEKILGQPIVIDKPTWHRVNDRHPVDVKNYAVLIVGAGNKQKRWQKFDAVASYLFKRFGLKIVFVGLGSSDKQAIQQAIKYADFEFEIVYNQRSLMRVSTILANAQIVVGNDSGLIHIAALQNVPTVCLSLGAHAYRFNAYPESFNFKTTFLFPPELEHIKHRDEFKYYSSRYTDSYDVRSISIERVRDAVKDMLLNE